MLSSLLTLPGPKARLASIDAYRGFVMLLILAEVLRTCAVAAATDWPFWGFVCSQQSHAAWVGCSLHDLIQPSFYFLVGIALLLSIRRRLSSGQTIATVARHVLTRSLILIVLGMALYSIHPRVWMWRFTDTLTQIGLACPPLLVIALRPKRDWYLAFAAILGGYWLWFALTPVAPPIEGSQIVGASASWLGAHGLSGFAAHWQKNSNPAFAFDRWFINLFPGEGHYAGDISGLTTLNFIPSIGTMILGLVAADVLQSARRPWARVRWLCLAGPPLIGGGWALGALGVCPVVKAIWTPSWVLFSGGWCFLFLAAFYALVDAGGFLRPVMPLRVIGMNSIVAYSMSHVYPAVAFNSLRRVLGTSVFLVLGAPYQPLVYGSAVLTMYWLVLFVLYRRRVFFRI